MQLKTVPITLKKRYPLRISRGLITENQNLLVTVSDGNFCGYGEMAAGGGIYSVTPEAGETPTDSETQEVQFEEVKE